jgi:ABC-type antimicrobial peptide transport system permease subunit
MRLFDLLAESLTAVLREARRTAPMAAGIVWGVASVFLLVAVARGFETSQRAQLEALGDSFLLLRVNRATESRGDVRANAFVRLDDEDITAIRAGAPAVEALSPRAASWFVRVYRGENIGRASVLGVEPAYADIVRVPLLEGRFIDANDIANETDVCVIGPGVHTDLFKGGPCIGEELRVVFMNMDDSEPVQRRLTVVGVLADDEISGDDFYVSHRGVVFMPFTTWERTSAEDFQFFVMRPRKDDGKEVALSQVREVLGRRHGFDPTSPNSLVAYFDAYERGARIDAVFGGLRWFLVGVGVLIMSLGAIGVANVVLMSVTARAFEFGLRRALGAARRDVFAQVFVEAALVCVTSGLCGFALGAAGIAALGLVDLPAGFAPPRAELAAAWTPGVLLLFVSLAAASWPALRAARMAPSIALRGGGAR